MKDVFIAVMLCLFVLMLFEKLDRIEGGCTNQEEVK